MGIIFSHSGGIIISMYRYKIYVSFVGAESGRKSAQSALEEKSTNIL